MRIGLIKKMMIFEAVVAILMDLGRLIPAYAADSLISPAVGCSVPLKQEGTQPE